MDQPADSSLDPLLADLLPDFRDVAVEASGEFSRAGVVFAARIGVDAIELRLGPEIAEAATRTPDTFLSSRGAGWVRFAPRVWDEHAFDRLEAWFRVAWRFAAPRR